MSQPHIYAAHDTQHAAVAQLPQLSHSSHSMLQAAAAELSPQTRIPFATPSSLGLSPPAQSWQQQHHQLGHVPTPSSVHDLEHVFQTGDLPWPQQQQQHSFQPPAQYAQYNHCDWQQQCQHMPSGARLPAMTPNAVQPYDRPAHQYPSAVSQSPFSGNPFNNPFLQTSVHAQQVTFPEPELRLLSVHTSPASSRGPILNPLPVQPEVASPPSTPDSFTSIELQEYRMHTQQQQQQHPMYPVHQFQRQPVTQFPNNMPGARVPSPLGIQADPYSTNTGNSHHRGSSNSLPDSSSNTQQQQQQYQRWCQPSSEYTTPRGTFKDAGMAVAATAAGPGNAPQQVSGSSKEELLKLALHQAARQQGEEVDRLVQQLLGALASATRSTGPNSSCSSSRLGAASTTSGAYAAGQAAPISDAAPSLPSKNPFANLEATPINAGNSPAHAITPSFVPYADSQQHQQQQQPAAAGPPSRLRAGQISAAAAASAMEQAATLHHFGVSVPAVRGSDGGASLMPVTPFANSSAGAQEALNQHLQDPWQQGWHASGDTVAHHPTAMHMQGHKQELQQQHQQQCMLSFEARPTAQQPMLPSTATIHQGQQQPSSQHQLIPVSDMRLAQQSINDFAGQDSSVPQTGREHAAVATNFYRGSICAHHTAGPHATAVAAQMQAMMSAAAMAPTAMLVPAAVLAAPAAMQAATAPQSLGSFNPNMAFGMYPAVPMAMPVAAAAVAANMQYYQMMQQQQQLYQAAAAAAGSQTATAASLAPGQHDGISLQPSNSMTSAGSVGLATAAAGAGVAGEGNTNYPDSGNRCLVLPCHSSTDANMLTRCSTAAAEMPALFPATAAWSMSGVVAAVAYLLGKGFGMCPFNGMHAQWAGKFNSTKAEELAVSPPVGVHGPGLSVVGQASSFPMAVAVKARDAAAQGMGLVAHSGAAVARMYFMVCVWYAHYLLVLVLYSLLGMTSVAVGSQQLVTGAGKLAAAGTVQLGLFAARQARLFSSAAVRVISNDLEKLPQQVLLQPLLVTQSMSTVHSKQLLLTEAPSASLTNGAAAAVLPADSIAVSTQASDNSGANAAALLTWPQAMMGLFNSSSGAKPGTVGTAVTATVADNSDASSSGVQQQQLVSSGSGRTASAAALMQCQQTQLQQRYNLYVADSVSVISGLWVGLGVKLWILVTIRVPVEASRIWLQACGQGVSFSAAAAAAATRYALHAAWLVVQCSALIFANTKLHLPQVCAAAVKLVGRTATAVLELSYQVALFWWVQLGSHTIETAQAMLKSAAESVPGGIGLLQCLKASAGFASCAIQHCLEGMRLAWHWLSSADEQAWKSLTMHSLLSQTFTWGFAAAAWGSGEIFGLLENLSVAATSRVLQGAPPMAQAAVWGSAGMLKRLVLEATQQSWLLLLGLYHAWQEQQRQQQQC